MILVNGPAKMGLNLAQKLCFALGLRDSGHAFVRLGPVPGISARRILDNEGGKAAVEAEPVLELPDKFFAHCHVAHYPGVGLLERHRMLLCWRDPRDAAISYARWAERTGRWESAAGGLLGLIRGDGQVPWRQRGELVTWAQHVGEYLPWAAEAGCHILRYEALADPATVKAAARFLGCACDAAAVAAGLLGDGANFQGRRAYVGRSSWSGGQPSRWEDWWSETLDDAWILSGGRKLTAAMGYA